MHRKSRKSKLKNVIETVTVLSAVATVVSGAMYFTVGGEPWFTLLLSFGTTFYHFAMRLLVGWAVNKAVRKRINYNNVWFRPKKFEKPLYRFLRVKNWKSRVPAYVPRNFSLKEHTIDEVIQAMCTAELVHEIIVAAGWLSLFFTFLTDDWDSNVWIFVATAFIAGAFDMIFVIVQRFNRPRIIKLKDRADRKKREEENE